MAERIATHTYLDFDREPFARKLKFFKGSKNSFVWERRVGWDDWQTGLRGLDPGLYNAHLLERAIKGKLPVHLTEGEKDADALLAAHPDWIVTSVPDGGGVWRDAWRDVLLKTGKVTVYADDDPTGLKHAAVVSASLRAAGQNVGVLLPAEGCNDVADHLEAGHGDKWRKVKKSELDDSLPEARAVVESQGSAEGGRDPEALLSMASERVREHGRNETGIWLACQLRDNGLSQADAVELMTERYVPLANALTQKGEPYLPAEARESVRQAYSREAREPLPAATSGLRLTDVGNAHRLALQHGDVLRYVEGDRKRWLHWDGVRWAKDSKNVALTLAKQTAETIYEEASDASSKEEKVALRKWAKQSEGSTRVNAMLAMAKDELAATSEDFDQDSWLLNCANGVIDLRSGELQEHDPDDFLTRLAPVAFDPEASAPRWEQFMREIMPGEKEREFLQRAVGYSLTGETSEQVMFIAHGHGSNGKSTFLEVLRKVVGDYSQTAPPEALIQNRNVGGASPDIARMRGARFVTASETSKNGELNETRVKQLTGSDTVAARGLYADYGEFIPTGKIWLATNHKPFIKGTDDGIWRRVPLIHFAQQFTGDAKDPSLMAALLKEGPGILAWAVRGCLEWQRLGLAIPESVVRETAEYRKGQDTFGGFLAERCKVRDGKSFFVEKTTFYEMYTVWCQNSGFKVMSKQGLNNVMKERGFVDKKKTIRHEEFGRKDRRVWLGVRLNGSH